MDNKTTKSIFIIIRNMEIYDTDIAYKKLGRFHAGYKMFNDYELFCKHGDVDYSEELCAKVIMLNINLLEK